MTLIWPSSSTGTGVPTAAYSARVAACGGYISTGPCLRCVVGSGTLMVTRSAGSRVSRTTSACGIVAIIDTTRCSGRNASCGSTSAAVSGSRPTRTTSDSSTTAWLSAATATRSGNRA